MTGARQRAVTDAFDDGELTTFPTEIDERALSISRSDLVDRLGPASGAELFERIDSQFRRGDRVVGTTVRAARESFSAARFSRHARLVMRGRAGGARATEEIEQGMVMIALEDLEAVVKAGQREFDWLAEFAPRHDLPTATASLVLRPGAPARRMLEP